MMQSPGLRYPPPLWLFGGFLLGWLLEVYVRRVHLTNSDPATLYILGGVLSVSGLVVIAWGALTLVRWRTAILPNRPASTLVETGPFRLSRNPMYAGFTIVYLGAALLLNSGWTLMALPFALYGISHFAIRREEWYLADAFGAEYVSYRQRVRRWL